jgi:acetyl esterase/lipase
MTFRIHITVLLILSIIRPIQAQTTMDTSTIYIHQETASLKSRAVQAMLAMVKAKKILERKMTAKKINQEAASLPRRLQKKYTVVITEKKGRKIWMISPKNTNPDKTILYIHGGAYILNISGFQWKFVEAILEKTNATMVIPDYPLAPSASYKQTYDFIQSVYDELLQTRNSNNIILMGDSAGGGFIAGFAQKQRNENKPQPGKIIMLAPWLDINMNNPEIIKADKADKMLGIKGTQLAGKAYAGNLDTKNYLVSPIYGDFSGLGKISIFIGTHDLLLADCRKLKDILTNANIPFKYYEYPKMFHGWMVVTGLKESKITINQIAALISE